MVKPTGFPTVDNKECLIEFQKEKKYSYFKTDKKGFQIFLIIVETLTKSIRVSINVMC